MNWTKVTDALPHDGEAVMVTVHDQYGRKYVISHMVCVGGYWGLPWGDEVTHWTPMPTPAEDEL